MNILCYQQTFLNAIANLQLHLPYALLHEAAFTNTTYLQYKTKLKQWDNRWTVTFFGVPSICAHIKAPLIAILNCIYSALNQCTALLIVFFPQSFTSTNELSRGNSVCLCMHCVIIWTHEFICGCFEHVGSLNCCYRLCISEIVGCIQIKTILFMHMCVCVGMNSSPASVSPCLLFVILSPCKYLVIIPWRVCVFLSLWLLHIAYIRRWVASHCETHSWGSRDFRERKERWMNIPTAGIVRICLKGWVEYC